jgi:hypothetical protein
MKPKKRNGYYYLNDKEYVSVTKVLGDVLSKPALYYWFKQQAARIALKEPELNEKEVIAKVDLITSDSVERGHYVHSIAEIMPNIDIDKIIPKYAGYINALKSWWNTNNPQTIHTELELFTDTYNVAGRCDKVMLLRNDNWIIDFKTGKDLYKEVGLQLAIYKFMANEKGYNIKHTGALLLMEDGGYKFCQTNDNLEDFVNVLNVWRWLKKKGE